MKGLLALAVGPVQEFIAKARRTRDLYFGSWVLSEIAKAAAARLRELGAELIFPAPETDLAPDSLTQVANKILAIVPLGTEPDLDRRCRTFAAEARSAADARWKRLAEETLAHVRKEKKLRIVEERFHRQIESHLEWACAWTPLDDDQRDYQARRDRVELLLSMRKTLRDFPAFPGEAGVPKSSLDGARETVLVEEDGSRVRAGSALRPGEQLCAIGLVKRFGAGRQPFPSVAHLAASPTIRGCARFGDEKERTVMTELAAGIDAMGERESVMIMPDLWGRASGAFLFLERLSEDDRQTEAGKRVKQAGEQFRRLAGEPLPYYAILLGDGDRMGETISAIASPDEHRRLSAALLLFCDSAKTIVHQHHGKLVYAGGDDVLALLPVDTALACSRAIRDAFVEQMAACVGKHPPTFSVGLAINHAMDPLETGLENAREAVKAAKDFGRNALAIVVDKRGGSPVTVVAYWTASPDDPADAVGAMQHAVGLHLDDVLPDGAAYELRRLAAEPLQGMGEAWGLEINRILRRKRVAGGTAEVTSVTREALLAGLGLAPDRRAVERLADRLIAARLFAEARARADGRTLRSNRRVRKNAPQEVKP